MPPCNISEALELMERYSSLKHWERHHVDHEIFPNEPEASVLSIVTESAELVHQTFHCGAPTDDGLKMVVPQSSLIKHSSLKWKRLLKAEKK